MFNKIKKMLRFSENNRTPIITQKQALEALESVNRQPKSAFAFFERAQTTTQTIDSLEEIWWNMAGNLIEDIWGLPDDLCLAYRQEYAMRAKKFFLSDKQKVKVVDLGCGTGWFGRIIADENVFYEGVDFSETQIQIAKKKAINAPNEKYLNYLQTTDIQSIKNIKDFDGIIINAFLHHLCKNELVTIFDTIKSTFKSGTKIFIMEPVYPTNRTKNDIKVCTSTKVEVTKDIINTVKKQAVQANIFDLQKEILLSDLIRESNTNGFFFSPKEVPFEFQEIEELLVKYTNLKSYSYVGVDDFSFLQTLSFIGNSEYRREILDTMFPMIKELDRQIIDSGYHFNGTNNYIFTCFECVLL